MWLSNQKHYELTHELNELRKANHELRKNFGSDTTTVVNFDALKPPIYVTRFYDHYLNAMVTQIEYGIVPVTSKLKFVTTDEAHRALVAQFKDAIDA